jgi:hypothetical protein
VLAFRTVTYCTENEETPILGFGCKLPMDGKGAWRDNVFVERLWRSVSTNAFT